MLGIKKMKNLLHYIAAGVTPYLFFAFTFWDANPANWKVEDRAFCAVITFCTVGFIFMIKNNIE